MQTTTSDLLRTAQLASPGQRKLTPLANNAFRLLGLSCRATQKEIYAAASSLRRAIKLGVDRTPTHRIGWLGSLAHTENSVRDALSRLADPAQRINERFFWFFDPQEISDELSFPSLPESIARLRAAPPQPSTGHDIALLSLAALLQLDPCLFLADEWQRAYALWKELIETKEFWSLLVAADLKGDFEQVTTFDEVRNLRGRAWRLVTAPVAESAKDGILQDDHPLARRALAILRRSELPQTLADEYENDILAPVEDKFDTLFLESFYVYRIAVKINQSVDERRESCDRALVKFDEEIKPALRQIFELAGARSPVTRRMCEIAAEGLDELAEGFETALEPWSRLITLRRAWQLAPPESATLLLIEERLQAAGELQERQPKTDSDYAHQLHLALVRQPVAQAELFTSYVRKETAAKTSEGRVKLFAKIVLVLLFIVFIGKCYSSLPGSRRYSPPPLNFNVPMPRFTPSPMPELQLRAILFHIPPEMLEAGMILKTAMLVDVSPKNEYDAKHIQSAISIPAGELAARAERLPKSKQIVLYSSDAKLTERAALELQTLGFGNVAVLEGGFQAWVNSGRPVTRQRASTRRRDRAVVVGTTDR